MDPKIVGCHPCNREKTMLIPTDCHDLLDLFSNTGFSFLEFSAVACEIPPTAAGKEIRNASKAMVAGADGLLPAAHD